MKYFFDTEFIENGRTIDLISIGIVNERGVPFYRQNRECNFKAAGDWVWRNVFPRLTHFDMRGDPSCVGGLSPDSLSNARTSRCGQDCPWRTEREIRDDVLKFFNLSEDTGKIEMWGYYSDYDWVAFCQLFGTMMDLPKGFPRFCYDLKQLCVERGDPEMPDLLGAQPHHAMNDAILIQSRYNWLLTSKPDKTK